MEWWSREPALVVNIARQYHSGLRRKHRRTLEAIYKVQKNLDWKDIEALFRELGAEVRERAGSRVRFRFPDGTRAVFHEPHPSGETGRATVRAIMSMLKTMGVKP